MPSSRSGSSTGNPFSTPAGSRSTSPSSVYSNETIRPAPEQVGVRMRVLLGRDGGYHSSGQSRAREEDKRVGDWRVQDASNHPRRFDRSEAGEARLLKSMLAGASTDTFSDPFSDAYAYNHHTYPDHAPSPYSNHTMDVNDENKSPHANCMHPHHASSSSHSQDGFAHCKVLGGSSSSHSEDGFAHCKVLGGSENGDAASTTGNSDVVPAADRDSDQASVFKGKSAPFSELVAGDRVTPVTPAGSVPGDGDADRGIAPIFGGHIPGDCFVTPRDTSGDNENATNADEVKLSSAESVRSFGNPSAAGGSSGACALNGSRAGNAKGKAKAKGKGNPRIHFFGLMFSSLGEVGIVPSAASPLVNPLPLSLGIQILADSKNPGVYLIHAKRHNAHYPPAQQQQIFMTLSQFDAPAPPRGPPTPICLYFYGPSAANMHAIGNEALARLQAAAVIKATGAVGPGGCREYRVNQHLAECSKRCAGCFRWEAVVPDTKSSGYAHKYRRWFTCGSCGCTWFCRQECLEWAWNNMGHWKPCLEWQKVRQSLNLKKLS